MLTKDMKDLIRAFNANGAEYLIIGGFAFGVHAQPRATKDLDLFIRSDARNSAAVFKALAEYGSPLHGLTVKDLQDASTGLQIGVPPNRIDILQKIDGVTFEEAWQSRVQAVIEGDTPTSGSGHNAADFYANVLHAMSTPALTDRQIIASVRDHVSPQER